MKIFNKKGYTIPTAVAYMAILLVLAGSMLLVASYRYQNAALRRQQNQLVMYATAIVDKHSEAIYAGGLNETLVKAIDQTRTLDSKLDYHQKSYKFEFVLDEEYTDYPFGSRKIDLEVWVTYESNRPGALLPSDNKDYLQVGDRMKVEYRIRQVDLEYRVVADYYGATDASVDSMGYPSGDTREYADIKWGLNQYMGKFYLRDSE